MPARVHEFIHAAVNNEAAKRHPPPPMATRNIPTPKRQEGNQGEHKRNNMAETSVVHMFYNKK